MDNLNDYILVLKNIIPNTLCENIVKEYKNCNQWTKASTRKGSDDMHRNCEFLSMTVQNSNYRKELDIQVYNVTVKCLEEYNKKHNWCAADEDTGYDLLRYKKGGYYKQHIDSFIKQPRLLSCSLVLNDDYEGGEFYFFDRELKYKLDKGDAIMFPSNFMYPHEVMPVTQGTRYSIITWFI